MEEGGAKAAQMHYLKASLLEKNGSSQEALQEYEEAFRHDPRSAFLCREAAELALEAADGEKALVWAQRLLKLEPKGPQAYVLLGRVRWSRGETGEAEAAFEEALKLDPASADSIFALGRLLGARSPKKARALMTRFLEANPEHAVEAYFQMAKLDFQEGKVDDAIARLKKGLSLEPGSVPLRLDLAQGFEMKGSTAAALAEYLEVLKADSYNVALIDHVGEIYEDMGDMEEARARFQSAVQIDPSDPTANLWLALDWERRGDFGQAASRVGASRLLAEDPNLNLRLSYYLTQAGRLKEAVAALEVSLGRWPGNDQIAYFLALGYDDLKMAGKAADVLRKVLEIKPDFRDARYQLAVLLEKQGRIDEAEKEFRLLLSDKPDDASILNYLGYSLADRGLKLEEAESLVRKAVELEPGNGAFRDSLGWALFKQGRSTQAVQELGLALRFLPEDETVSDHLGDALAAAGDPAAAWRAWKRSEALASGGPAAGKAKAVQSSFKPAELGGYFMEHLAAMQGGLRRLGALCRVHGTVLGQGFDYDAMLDFDAGREQLSMDLLGPLFTPMFRIGLGPQGLVMDELRLPGVKQEALSEAVRGTFLAVRETLSGTFFALRPSLFKKGWRGRSLRAPGWRFGLDASDARLASVSALEAGPRLQLDRYEKVKGKLVPTNFKVSGLGYTVTIELEQLKAEFAQAAP
jgi:tetratricopeptide (TPR) repeat protein